MKFQIPFYQDNLQNNNLNNTYPATIDQDNHVLGIHLGNTNCYSAISKWNIPFMISNSENQIGTPSYVSLLNDGNLLIGQPAKNQIKINHLSTFCGAKRFIGIKFDDPIIQKNSEKLPQNIVRGQNGDVCFSANSQIFTRQQVCSKIISQFQQIAGFNFKFAIISLPDYFNEQQRSLFFESANSNYTGLKIKRLIKQSTAVCLSYFDAYNFNTKKIAVCHLGGYTFSISILNYEDGIYDIVSTQSDIFSGGEEINNLLSEYIIKQFISQKGINITKCNDFIQNVNDAAEKAKCELSYSDETSISIEYLSHGNQETRHFNCSISRLQFEDICEDFLKNTIRLSEKCLMDSGYPKHQIDKVILTGGSTRIPLVEKFVTEYFGKQIYKNSILPVLPDEDKAKGAASLGQLLCSGGSNKLFFSPLNLGIELFGWISVFDD
ncbi:hypothetical protein ABPG72_002418 [Tetrahymena utriculariae]